MKSRPYRISESQKEAFCHNGYLHLEGFFTPEQVEYLRRLSDDMSSQAAATLESAQAAGESLSHRAKTHPHELIVVPEATDPAQVCRYEFMIGGNAKFNDFIGNDVEPAISAVVGQAVLPFKDKTNEKLPGGGAFRPHQDFAAYQFFEPRYHVTAQISIDPATVENGCVQFSSNLDALAAKRPDFVAERVEGRILLHFHRGGANHGDIRADIAAALEWQPFNCAPLDLLVFDSFVPHWSDINRSSRPRRAIFVTFNLAAEGSLYDRYYAEKRANYDDPKFHVSTPTAHRPISPGAAQ
jgi:ectoine hydroxylase-related dioxygenase (phytanoyl-CoA dioxygenase family)